VWLLVKMQLRLAVVGPERRSFDQDCGRLVGRTFGVVPLDEEDQGAYHQLLVALARI
jgi:hypothetical protein